MDLSKERTMILEMIAEGKITVEEGEELIKALNTSVRKKGTGVFTYADVDDIPPSPPIPPIPALGATRLRSGARPTP